ncbi:MAG TPA: DNA-3-methyladenine glycosylase I [Verrucomicrobiae bacterium]|nr:DNA-3-methyladenine glycosylase I [Verrucomicrobiae bacterium]
MSKPNQLIRCEWPSDDALMIQYHDTEWGVPVHDDRKLFEFLVLDAMQAGLSWRTVLHKRQKFRKAFDNFDAEKVARYSEKRVAKLLQDPGIIRNRLKVHSAVTNARAMLAAQEQFGSFDRYIWQFVGGRPQVNRWKSLKELPAKTKESDAMSKDMKQGGFTFCGSTICYAFMQAAGMVNDHVVTCFRHREVQR